MGGHLRPPYPESLQNLVALQDEFKLQPLVSIVMPVYNTPEKWLTKVVDSVRAQAYPEWELCIADDASPAPHVRPALEKLAASDPRIKVTFREKTATFRRHRIPRSPSPRANMSRCSITTTS
jgi:cellulose synthase/poly-beta-1,6-N-acetylglucosamine synthase-like glycosyltransferase